MNRRLFISQASAGLVLPFLPYSVLGRESSQGKGNLDKHLVSQIIQEVQSGILGTVQQIVIQHIYSPDTLELDALERIAQQDINACTELTGLQPLSGNQLINQASPAPLYGSCAVELGTDTLKITWQALAHFGSPAKLLICQLQLLGSEGVLQLDKDGQGYQIQDLMGRTIRQMAPKQIV